MNEAESSTCISPPSFANNNINNNKSQVTANGHNEDSQRLSKQFNAAVKIINNLPKAGPFEPSNELKLRFYGFYKQATKGPCTQSKPGFWDVVNRAKWDAWKSLGDMSQAAAMDSYISILQELIETIPLDDNVEGFLHLMNEADSELKSNYMVFVKDTDSARASESKIHIGNGNVVTNGQTSRGVEEEDLVDDIETTTTSKQNTNNHIPNHPKPLPSNGPSNKGKRDENNLEALSEEDETFADATDSFILGEHLVISSPSSSSSPGQNELPRFHSKGKHRRTHDRKGTEEALNAAWEEMKRERRGRRRGKGVGEEGEGRAGRKAVGRREEAGTGGKETSLLPGNSQPSSLPNAELVVVGAEGGRGSEGSGSEESSGLSSSDLGWDPHVATVLFRMHRQLEQIRRKLDTMEGVMVTQQRILQSTLEKSLEERNKSKLWFFSNLPWRTIGFIVAWPVIVNFLIRLYWKGILLRRRRRL